MAGPLDTRQTSGAGVAGMILLWLIRACARWIVRRFRWPQAIGQREPRSAALRASPRRQLLRSAAPAPVAPQGGA
ncbi:hypothetical protein JNUCC31_18650 [Paenibacillus sp. JNUCC31]|uniref:hypothetical protein n=1 Tax=Paenibacillus sp. JNUCC-31 TaxID=2777983 RepID=UPI00177BC62C|nr:hypothetical protein [Paenibacillus sp. JNUCC-31]QOS76853.1 hypothetical protein JNUCC31_18650 [Paenibacillus sp. JNUCC-31]